MDKDEIVRRRIVFYGSVQGVGFRYRARYAADRIGLTGWVRNNDDFETVTMEVQGGILQIRDLIRMVQQGKYVHIKDMRIQEIPLEKGERGFKVIGY